MAGGRARRQIRRRTAGALRRESLHGGALRRGALLLLASAAATGGITLPAMAQSLPSMERAVAGQTTILRRFTPPPRLGSIDLTVEDQRREIPEAEAEELRFTLDRVTLTGARTLTPADLSEAWAGELGTEITLAELYAIADRIDAAYVRAGYFVKTVVPVQDFATGDITLTVFESYVQDIEITSDIPDIEARLAPYLQRILDMHPIRIAEAERVLLLMSDLGGLDIEGTFVKPDTPSGGGTLRLGIEVERVSGMIGLDNLGTRAVGPYELSGQLTGNDLLGLFESTSLVGVTIPDRPEELGLLQVSQMLPIGTDGLAADWSLSYVTQKPGGSLRNDDIHVQSVIGTAALGYPLLRSLDENLFVRGEMTLRKDDVRVMGNHVVDSHTGWISAVASYDRDLEIGAFAAAATLGQGLGFDTDDADIPRDYRFGRLDVDFTRPLFEDTALRLRMAGQYSADALPGAAQFTLGGDPYGWAFDGGTLSGDSGAAAALELSHDLATGMPDMPGLTVTAFADYGAVWNHGAGADYGRSTLGSAGIGVSGMLGDRLLFQVIGATPWHTGKAVEDPGSRIFFRLSLPL